MQWRLLPKCLNSANFSLWSNRGTMRSVDSWKSACRYANSQKKTTMNIARSLASSKAFSLQSAAKKKATMMSNFWTIASHDWHFCSADSRESTWDSLPRFKNKSERKSATSCSSWQLVDSQFINACLKGFQSSTLQTIWTWRFQSCAFKKSLSAPQTPKLSSPIKCTKITIKTPILHMEQLRLVRFSPDWIATFSNFCTRSSWTSTLTWRLAVRIVSATSKSSKRTSSRSLKMNACKQRWIWLNETTMTWSLTMTHYASKTNLLQQWTS